MCVGKLPFVAAGLVAALLLGSAGLLTGRAGTDTLTEYAPVGRAGDKGGVDRYGDPLPSGAVVRLGTVRFRFSCVATAFLADGKTVVSAEQGGGIKLWDARTG